jgi:hypothetical protein
MDAAMEILLVCVMQEMAAAAAESRRMGGPRSLSPVRACVRALI